MIVALLGNPNAGKTTVFNALCGARQQTGNYAGVTVEKKVGFLTKYPDIKVVDLPGTYSLRAKSADEAITADVLAGITQGEQKPDVALVVLDAANLKRSLYLVLQLQETDIPLMGVLTMSDIGARRGIAIDTKKLSNELGFPIFEVTMASAQQVNTVAEGIKYYSFSPSPQGGQGAGGVRSPDQRYIQIDKILKPVISRTQSKNQITDQIDSVLTHRVWGLFSFVAIIGMIFFSIYAGARPIMDAIDGGMKNLGSLTGNVLGAYPMTSSLVSDGVIAGAGSVFVFLPQIMILFLFISILEETGYLARAAFLMDKLLGWTGLNGRAFIPLLSSFACAVPGIMSARVMPTDRARMATILIAPLMSCSARLPVYVLFIGAFVEPKFGALWAAAALFAMHLVGIAIAMPLAWLLNRKILKTSESPFILELPEYHMPHWPNVWRRVYDSARGFLVRVGTIIFALSIVIWALAYFPHDKKFTGTETEIRAQHLSDSYLGRMGRAVEPAFAPLGFDWKISIAVLAAFPAREVFVSTLGIIYSVADAKDEPAALGKKLSDEKKLDGSQAYTALVALSIMVFFALCAQCMSTLATIRRELMSTSWAVAVFVVMTSLAYVASFLIYQIGRRYT